MDAQYWIVGISNTIHLISTVIWIGWSAFLPLVVAPRAVDAHSDGESLLAQMNRRLVPVAYGALAALGATGMIQMSAHPQYDGMLSVSNFWSALLFVKHLLIVVSVVLIVYLGHRVSPRLRLDIRRSALGLENQLDGAVTRFRVVAWLNLAMGVGVLALTGLMTAIR
jgi:uncharacterized membrane protein